MEALKADGTIRRRVTLRRCKYLNSVIEQDHRTAKKRGWLAKSSGSFQSAWRTLQAIETVHMSWKGRVRWLAKGDAAGQAHFPGELFGLSALPRFTLNRLVLACVASSPNVATKLRIYGHGLGDSSFGGPTIVSPVLAQAGFATVSINAAGHGFGPRSNVVITDKSGNGTTVMSGGRGVDLDGNGIIGSTEGCLVLTPAAVGLRDCFRQTVVDLMQLVRVIQAGVDRPAVRRTESLWAVDALSRRNERRGLGVRPAVRLLQYSNRISPQKTS